MNIKALFSHPDGGAQSPPYNESALPVQRRITGHKQTDAIYGFWKLSGWVNLHIWTQPKPRWKIKISPKEAEERYFRYLMANGGDPSDRLRYHRHE